MGTATTSISGTLDRKMNASPECIANRGALFLCHSSPPVGPCVALCRGLQGWVEKTLGSAPTRAVLGQHVAGLDKPQNRRFWRRVWQGRKASGRKCRGCCCTPAWFTAPGNAGRVGLFRASGLQSKKGLLNSYSEKNGAANRINGGIPPNIPGLRRQKGVLQDFGTKGQIQVRAVAPPGHAGESQGAIPAGRLPQ